MQWAKHRTPIRNEGTWHRGSVEHKFYISSYKSASLTIELGKFVYSKLSELHKPKIYKKMEESARDEHI